MIRPPIARAVLLVMAALVCPATTASARVEMTREEALRMAFPPPHQVERRTLYLDDAQAREAGKAAGVEIEARVVPYYVGSIEGRVTGYAYFDTHIVRTLPETLMIRIAPDGAIIAIDVVAFDEPQDYRVTARWLEQFRGLPGEDARSLTGGIRSLTGATLSARAVTEAARRVLALHRLFVQGAAGGGAP